MFIIPTEQTIEYAKKNHDDGKPLVQINLFSYNKNAKYKDSTLNTISGRDAYKKYSDIATKAVMKVGGKVLWWSRIRLTMIGPDKDKWDEVGVVWYPNMKKFLEMTEIDWYKTSFIHREAALADTRLITCYDMSQSMKMKLRLASWFGRFFFK
ncbi:MAG: DUF1330 domain-containing protein [Candidatus Marinimicrobia bacterium]|jgi:uncharacterized protein (DUF1330 family)|nr:DUF1330 domain-containing protein [Candidatus Neomarinimicrobiota bacterium]|tara:strand:+ start:30 stop:488 length:459 start_codon:yes stop_codon:yes gene_type:complete